MRIEFNEKITTRGMNNLYFEINFYEGNKRIYCIDYRRTIASTLHETPIYKWLEKHNMQISTRLYEETRNNLNKVVELLEKLEKIGGHYGL